jgi:hypothetical protein
MTYTAYILFKYGVYDVWSVVQIKWPVGPVEKVQVKTSRLSQIQRVKSANALVMADDEAVLPIPPPGLGVGLSVDTFTSGTFTASYSLVLNGLNLFCGCFVRSFQAKVQDGIFVYEAKVESKCSSTLYLVQLHHQTPSLNFKEVHCTCLAVKDTSLCSHSCALIWAVVAVRDGWTDYPRRLGKMTFSPNYSRQPLQRHEAFAELLPIVEWNEVMSSLYHDRPVKGGSASKLKVQKKQKTKKGIAGLRVVKKNANPDRPYDHLRVVDLKELLRSRGLKPLSGKKDELISRLTAADQLEREQEIITNTLNSINE